MLGASRRNECRAGIDPRNAGAYRCCMTHALHAVLVVEDDDDSRDALVAVLEAYGYVVCEATDGQDALDR